MSKRIPVPPELEHLIEKREQEPDRREAKQQPRGAEQAPANPPLQSERRQKRDRRRRPKSNS